MKLQDMSILLIAGIYAIVANVIGYHHSVLESLIGTGLLIVITIIGIVIAKVVPLKLPVVFWISLIALLCTSAINPFGVQLAAIMGKIEFMALATTVLAYVGLSLGKDLPVFKNIGWRIIIVALAVYTGTFVLSTAIAQVVLKIEGII